MTTEHKFVPTLEDVERLKENWINDPCWDIEETEGYESYREELAAFANAMRTTWDAEHNVRIAKEQQRVETRARELECSETLVRHIEWLELRIARLEEAADRQPAMTKRSDCNIVRRGPVGSGGPS